MSANETRSNPPTGTATKLDALRFERTQEQEVTAALSALDCVLLRGKGVYASSELTSGRRAQRLQRDHGVADSGTLRELLGSERYDALVWNPNVAAAIAFACELRDRMDGAELVISPAPFIAPGWPQSAYLAFWETVIRTRVKAVYFNDGWEYSNGCVYEFAVAHDTRLPTFDRPGMPVSVQQGAERIAAAIRVLDTDRVNTDIMKSSLRRLEHS